MENLNKKLSSNELWDYIQSHQGDSSAAIAEHAGITDVQCRALIISWVVGNKVKFKDYYHGI